MPAKACSEDFEAATSGELYFFGCSRLTKLSYTMYRYYVITWSFNIKPC